MGPFSVVPFYACVCVCACVCFCFGRPVYSVADRIPTHWVGTVSSPDGKEFTDADEKAITQVCCYGRSCLLGIVVEEWGGERGGGFWLRMP